MAFSFLKDYNDPDVINCSTYSEVILNRVISCPEKVAFRFLDDGEKESESFTYDQLQIKAKAIASLFQEFGKKGDPVLLLFHPSLSYVASLFACLFSGFVAIPAYPPRRNRGVERIYSILEDSEAKICLLSKEVKNDIERNFADNELFKDMKWIVYDDVTDKSSSNFEEVDLFPEDVALIQYTSGSTGQPKGVMLTQQNLLYNSEYIRQSFNHDRNLVGVNWLPIFHDMGLIGTVLQPPYVSGTSILMPSMAFLKNPYLWLKAIEKYKATTIGGPNFTYDYCVDKIPDQKKGDVDLSSIKIAFCGAETIRKSTYDRFIGDFDRSNARYEQLYSCYGMAETTLIVTGGFHDENPKFIVVDANSLSKNKIVKLVDKYEDGVILVGCGHTWMDTKIEIIDPVSLRKCKANEVGEIWVSGPTVAAGYWKKPEETQRIFNAHISTTGEGPFLRTGDLGFVVDNELYITGRIKDLIIIRGVNHYPGDIEFSVQKYVHELRKNGGAAFPVTVDGIEKLVIVQEVERTAMRNTDHSLIISKIREVVAEKHELDIHAVVLIRPGSIPMTSSGKVQHRQTKFEYLNNELNIVAGWENIKSENLIDYPSSASVPTEDSIKEWVVNWIVRNQNINKNDIDLDMNLMSFGIDSLAAVTLETEISKQFGFQWHVSSFILNPTINKLAEEGMEIYNETMG